MFTIYICTCRRVACFSTTKYAYISRHLHPVIFLYFTLYFWSRFQTTKYFGNYLFPGQGVGTKSVYCSPNNRYPWWTSPAWTNPVRLDSSRPGPRVKSFDFFFLNINLKKLEDLTTRELALKLSWWFSKKIWKTAVDSNRIQIRRILADFFIVFTHKLRTTWYSEKLIVSIKENHECYENQPCYDLKKKGFTV